MRHPLQGQRHIRGRIGVLQVCAGEDGTPWRHKMRGAIFLQQPLQA